MNEGDSGTLRTGTGTGTIGAAEAAARLQVKLETIYAYVSRGLLTRLT